MSMEVIEVFGSEIVSGTREVDVIEFAPSGPQGIPGTGGIGGAVDSVNGRAGPVVLTSADVGLSNVNNTSDANKPVSTAQAAADTAVANAAASALAAHAGNTSNPHAVTAAQVGLGNVENKSSATIRSEITSGNVTTALGYTPENSAQKGVAGGYVPLDGTGKVASTYLPSYVDDVLEYANLAAFPGTGETGKMYVALDTNKVYRWSGSAYVEISGSPGSTDAVPEGASNLYFTAARVLTTVLSGLSTATNAVITAADTVLTALGKLQKQISDNLTTLTSHTGNTSNPHSTTAAQVGAVAKAGDTMTGALNWASTQTIASAATTDIGAATSNSVIVSGTTTITGLGTIAAGAERVVQFSGALTLTHNATSLILPGGANITTAAGDVAYFVSLGSGNWRCTGYQKANGQSVVASGGSPGGSSGNLQVNNGSGGFSGVTGSSVSGADITLGGNLTSTLGTFLSGVANGASAVGFNFSTPSYSTSGAMLARWKNNATTAMTISRTGAVTCAAVEFNHGLTGYGITYGNGALSNGLASSGSVYWLLPINGAGGAEYGSAVRVLWHNTSTVSTTGANIDAGLARDGASRVAVLKTSTAGDYGDLKLRSLISSGGVITLSSYTVATLPTAASNTHAIVAVTDGNASPTYRGAVTGGGSTKGVVYCDGSSWMWH